MDPIGISLCLLITGLFIAGPMWRMNVLTIPDFFRLRYGKAAEILCAIILVPSYFGWIAAQFVALATILSQMYGGSMPWWIVIVAIIGSGYSLMGGMWSISITDTIQLVLIIVGLLVLGFEILSSVGQGMLGAGLHRVVMETPPEFWRLADPPTFSADVLSAVSILVIASLGNVPVQDLMQRVFSAKSPRVAATACYLAAVGYLAMGLLPILAGLAARLLLVDVPEEGVLTIISGQLLSPALSILFLLAIVSAVLSTMVSAIMAPAAVLAHNLLEPLVLKSGDKSQQHERRALLLQRLGVVVITAASIALALSGRSAMELVEDAYAMSLVGMFVPFVIGIYRQNVPPRAAIASMLVGIVSWLVHVVCGWDYFAEPLTPWLIPHELIDTALSAIAFLSAWQRSNADTIQAG
jgi:Na+/proline symporter